MTLKQKLETLSTEFNTLKDKILTKLAHKDELIQTEKDKSQESIRQLESALKIQSESEKAIENLSQSFTELTQQIEDA